MPTPLPQLQPKSYTPKPAPPFAEPPAKTPISFRTPKGTKPGQVTSPYRITKLGPPAGIPPAAAAAASTAGGGISVGGAAAVVLPAIAFVLFFDSPAAAPTLMHPPEPANELEKNPPPFSGGQMTVRYTTRHYGLAYGTLATNPADKQWVSGQSGHQGPIKKVRYVSRAVNNNPYDTQTFIYVTSGNGSEQLAQEVYTTGPYTGRIEFIPESGQPDTGGDPEPLTPPTYTAPGNSLGAPSAGPPSAAPSPLPKAPSLSGSPSGLPSSSGSPGGSPSSSGSPGGSPSPAPAPNPGPTPQPQLERQPSPSPEPNPYPFAEPAPRPGLNLGAPPGSSPSPTPAPAPTAPPSSYRSPPLPNPTDYPDTGFQPDILNPNPLTPNPLAPSPFDPNPDTGNPEPRAPPITLPPRSPDPNPNEGQQLQDQIRIGLGALTTILAGITALVQPNAIKASASAATCEAFSPTGCAAPVANNAQAAANNSAQNNALLNGLLAFLQALQTTFLIPIKAGVELANTKLGPLLKGADGISGFMTRLSSSLGVDRALNLIAIAANLHNAMMLSANLKITLLEMLSSIGNATGLLQTSEGANVDLNQVFNKGIENLLISIVGAESYAGLKVGLRKYNSIYQAATNSLNAVSSMFNSMGNVIEQGAEYTGKIGNSLKGAGVVVENAYQWMAEKFDTKSNKFIKFESTIGTVTQVLETVNEIASSVVEGQQSATEFQKANADFIKAVAEAKKNPGIENKVIKEEAEKAKASLVADPTGEDETGLLSFLTDL